MPLVVPDYDWLSKTLQLCSFQILRKRSINCIKCKKLGVASSLAAKLFVVRILSCISVHVNTFVFHMHFMDQAGLALAISTFELDAVCLACWVNAIWRPYFHIISELLKLQHACDFTMKGSYLSIVSSIMLAPSFCFFPFTSLNKYGVAFLGASPSIQLLCQKVFLIPILIMEEALKSNMSTELHGTSLIVRGLESST